MSGRSRRDFLRALGAAAVRPSTPARACRGATSGELATVALRRDDGPGTGASSPAVKPISGSWFEFQHHRTVEGVNWNTVCACFSCQQWEAKIDEIAGTGIKYLVLMCTALYYRAFYNTQIFPKFKLACEDPTETVLAAADKYGIKILYRRWLLRRLG